MNSIAALSEELKEKTGLEFSFCETDQTAREEIFADEEKTNFFFTVRGERYLGSLYGTGMAEYNYAVLLKKLLESSSGTAPLSKSEYLLSILSGNEPMGEMKRFAEKYAIPERECYAICLYVEKNLKETEEVVSQATTTPWDYLLPYDENTLLLFKFDGEEEYQSPSDFAEFLAQSVFEEVGVHPLIGVGGRVKHFAEAGDSFRQAALAVRMSKTFRSKGEVHTYKEFLLVKMLEEIPKPRRMEYMNEFLSDGTKELLEDDDMLNTVEEFFLNSLNLSETARKLFMHRNTLMYRLDKIERLTGLDVRKFSDAISFRVLTLLYKLQKEEKGE